MRKMKQWNWLQIGIVTITLCLSLGGSLFVSGDVFAEIELPDPPKTNLSSFETPDGPGEETLSAAMQAVIDVIKALLGVIATAWIVWSGILLVTGGGNDEQIEKGKRGVTWGTLGLILALMVDTVIMDVFDGSGGFQFTDNPANMNDAIEEGLKLTLDAIQWFKGLVIIGAVGFVIYSGIRTITALGDTEEINRQKTVFLWIGVGIIVILLNDVIIQEVLYPRILGDDMKVVYNPNAVAGISQAVSLIKYFLQFLGVIAFVAFVYGGAKMISAFGNEEQIESGKKILISASIGIVVILMSFVIVSTFVSGQAN